MNPFPFRCPVCGHNMIVTESNIKDEVLYWKLGKKHGLKCIIISSVVCANPECEEFVLNAAISHAEVNNITGRYSRVGEYERKWQLIPESNSKRYPAYIPEQIRGDYEEACLIKDKSPKASATLARRCLQGMIRDFWGVKDKKNLYSEIQAIEDKVDPLTWEAIDAVRKIGNIGAHMQRDIGLIVDVDTEEAATLINLVETLLDEWYVNREERRRRMERVKDLAASKEKERKAISD